MSKVTDELTALEATDVSDGLYEYSLSYKESMRSKFADFKEHTLDLALVTFADPEEGVSRRSALAKTVSGKELLKLPLAGVYALLALLCIIMFSVVHFPRKYAPIAYAKTKEKVRLSASPLRAA